LRSGFQDSRCRDANILNTKDDASPPTDRIVQMGLGLDVLLIALGRKAQSPIKELSSRRSNSIPP
jgi:hypothetical protein